MLRPYRQRETRASDKAKARSALHVTLTILTNTNDDLPGVRARFPAGSGLLRAGWNVGRSAGRERQDCSDSRRRCNRRSGRDMPTVRARASSVDLYAYRQYLQDPDVETLSEAASGR